MHGVARVRKVGKLAAISHGASSQDFYEVMNNVFVFLFLAEWILRLDLGQLCRIPSATNVVPSFEVFLKTARHTSSP